ncbi:hypothetical protein, partial [Sulfuriferula thiophila]|uniref:hypothetical protein n=1 Tax=Sulfuriferula thiophila TaxID=1781211 RepID=UPI001CB909CA
GCNLYLYSKLLIGGLAKKWASMYKSKGLATSGAQRSPESKTIPQAQPKLHNGQSHLTAMLDVNSVSATA